MKIKPLTFVALLGTAAMVTGESAVLFHRVDQIAATWPRQWPTSLARVDAGQITAGLVRALVRAAQ